MAVEAVKENISSNTTSQKTLEGKTSNLRPKSSKTGAGKTVKFNEQGAVSNGT
jgi:hypothetical protein